MKRTSKTTKAMSARTSGRNQPKSLKSSPLTPSNISSSHATENRQESSPSKYPVRYITENLIKKVSGKENVAWVTTLKLNLHHEGGKRFKYIENLEKCRHLEVLSLSCNQIAKIERLDKLTRLRELDLSFNCITHIEGLATLVGLQKLNLTGNLIESIPIWLGKRLKSLRVLRLGRNLLFSLHDIGHLRVMRDLTQLSIEQNPLCELAHYHQYIVFQLRSLEILNGVQITHDDRIKADERFQKEELENLEIQINKDNEKIKNLELNQSRTEEEMKRKDKYGTQLEHRNTEQKNAMKELEREIETKNELLRRKTAELTKACEKQYRLEQELAFYKIDHKFDPLGPYPEINNETEDGGTEEAAYLGKAIFKRNAYAGEGVIKARGRQIRMMQAPREMSEEKAKIEQQLHQVTDDRLAEKQRQIERAESRLEKLQDSLRKTEQQVLTASEELKNISKVKPASMPAEQKIVLQNQLADKMAAINQLREQVIRIEQDMDRTNDIIHQKERQMAQLKRQLDKVVKDDPKHANIEAALKQQIGSVERTVDDHEQLKRDMDRMLAKIAKETEALKNIEEQLVFGQADMNDELKEDLENVVGGLTDYLERVKKQAEECQRDNQLLHQEKDALIQELEQAEQLKQELEAEKHQAKQKQKYVDDLEASLAELQQDNNSLQKSMLETSQYIPDLEKKLKRSQNDNERLKAELSGRDTKAEDEIHALEDEVESEKDKLKQYKDANEAREQDYHRLVDQLGALQTINRSMKDNLKEQEQRRNDLANESIDPNDVSRRIDQVKERIHASKKGRLKPINEEDQVGKSLGDLQDVMEGKLKEAKNEIQKSKERQKEVEAELKNLKRQLRDKSQLDPPIKKDDKTEEIQALHDVIDRLSKQLEDAQKKNGRDEIDATPVEDDWPDWKQHDDLSDTTMKGTGKGRRGMKEKDVRRQRSDEKIGELETELQHLKDKLDQQTYRPVERSTRRPTDKSKRELEIRKLDAIADAEAHASEQVRKAATELRKAQEEINGLEHALSEREQELVSEIDRGDAASQTIGDQQQEIGILYETLEDQKAEILRLHDMLNQAINQSEDDMHPEGNPMHALLEEVEALRRAVTEQGQHIAKVTTPKQQGILKKGTHGGGRQHHGDMRHSRLRFSEENQQYGGYQPEDGSSFIQNVPSGWVSSSQSDQLGFTQPPNATSTPHQTNYYTPTHQLSNDQPIHQVMSHPVPTQQLPYHSQQMPDHHQPTHQMPPHHSVQFAKTAEVHNQRDNIDKHQSRKMEVPDDVLFCNVPEHHDLEDYVKDLERQLAKKKKKSKSAKVRDEELENRNDELEDLDLAIEKQKDKLDSLKLKNHDLEDERRCTNAELEEIIRGMNELKNEVDELRIEKGMMEKEMQTIRMTERKERRRDFLVEDQLSEGTYSEYSSDSRGRVQHIRQEIICTEKTLTKRRAELREADNLLHECEEDLKDVRQKANETLNQYDEVTEKFKQTHDEVTEMEKRAQESGKEIIHLESQLEDLKEEVGELKDLKTQREEEVKAIEIVIASRDNEFRSLETKTQHLSARLEKINSELLVGEQKVLEQSSAIRDATGELAEKMATLDHITTRISNQEEKLGSLLQDVAQKETELQRLSNSVDSSKQKLIMALKDGEAEVTETERKIGEAKFKLDQLNKEKMQLTKAVSAGNAKLEESRSQREETDRELQHIEGSIDKSKTELKHTLELIQIEKTELEALRIQHERKMAELEHTQIAALEERGQLENLQSEVQQKQLSLECTRQTIEIERAVKEQLTEEKLSMEAGISNLQREKEMLEGNCESMGSKVRQFRRQQSESEGAFENLQGHLEKLSTDVRAAEKDLNEMNNKRSAMLKELQATKHKLKDLHGQLKTSSKEVKDNMDKKTHLENELKDDLKLKKQVLQDVEQLKTDVSQERDALTGILSQQHARQEELHQLLIDVERRQTEAEDSKRVLDKFRADIQHEKEKMIKFQSQFERKESDLKSTLSQKTSDLRNANEQLKALQNEISNLDTARTKIQHLVTDLETLRHSLEERNEEKTQLAETLNFSHIEIQKLRNEKREIENQMLELELKLQHKQQMVQDANQSNQEAHKRMKKQLNKLTQAVEEHRSRANRLNQELLDTRQQFIQLQEKNTKLSVESRKDKKLEASLQNLRKEIKSEVSVGLKDLEMSRFEVMDELHQMNEQKRELNDQLDTLNHSIQMASLESHVDRDVGLLPNVNRSQYRDTVKEHFEHEQAMLKLKIKQQVERQAEILDSVRRKSESTLSGVRQKLCNFEELVNKSGVQSRLLLDDESFTI
ncbi:uncharacterized protein [Antedon mediterranea]|uniref:uncharacterized protein isoform X1 n=2 Tax=Antedon mediterranea TaxID=105859 RepID=UPI003AF46C6D